MQPQTHNPKYHGPQTPYVAEPYTPHIVESHTPFWLTAIPKPCNGVEPQPSMLNCNKPFRKALSTRESNLTQVTFMIHFAVFLIGHDVWTCLRLVRQGDIQGCVEAV